MTRHLLVPDTASYNAAISICRYGADWACARGLLQELVCQLLKPSVARCNAAVSACRVTCEKFIHLDRAIGLLQEIAPQMLMPDVLRYCMATDACEKGGHWEGVTALL